MRKLWLFLVLFGSGLLVLVLLSRDQRLQRQERVELTDPRDPATQELPFTRIPDDPSRPLQEEEEPSKQTSFAGVLSGAAAFAVFEETQRGHKLYDLELENVIPLGDDLYDLEGITAHTFDPRTEELESTLVAERGRARIEWREGRFTLGQTETVKLFDAQLTLHQGVPLAPLALTLLSVQGNLERGLFTSEEEVLVSGEGLHARGLGLMANQRQGVVLF
ncbi:MAG: hypothetical protein ABGY71_00945, partial [bacterium]